MMNNRERIARKVAQDMREGEFVNFGHGIPYSVGNYINPSLTLFIQNEPGVVCFGKGAPAAPGEYDMRDSVNAMVSELPGASFVDTASSFAMIRGGHIGKTVLGALQVDRHANIANWMTPGKPAAGIGGAMDLCAGCLEVLIAMESTTKDGGAKLVDTCDYPLTAVGKATKVYTEFGILQVNPTDGFTLVEIFPDYTIGDIEKRMGTGFKVAEDLQTIDLGVPLS